MGGGHTTTNTEAVKEFTEREDPAATVTAAELADAAQRNDEHAEPNTWQEMSTGELQETVTREIRIDMEFGDVTAEQALNVIDHVTDGDVEPVAREIFRNSAEGQTPGGIAHLQPGELATETTEPGETFRREFRAKYGENTLERAAEAANAWRESVFRDENTAAIFEHGVQETGNANFPNVRGEDAALHAAVTDADRKAVAAMHEHTTETLREAFGDEITVYRGYYQEPYRSGDGETVVDAFNAAHENGDGVTVEHRPVESWTTDPRVAISFASEDAGGVVVKDSMPVEEAVMSSSTGFPRGYEAEVVRLHDAEREYSPEQIIPVTPGMSEDAKRYTNAELMLESTEKIHND